RPPQVAPTPSNPVEQPNQPEVPTEEPSEEPVEEPNQEPNQPGSFEFNFVTPTENFEYSSKNILISWDLSNNQGLKDFSLEYSVKDSNTWNIIDESINKERNYYVWSIENIQNGEYQFRITLNFENGQEVINLSPLFK